MTSGKSFLARQLIENLSAITYSENKINSTEICFWSKSEESAHIMSGICEKNSFIFTWWKLIHPLSNLFDRAINGKHLIVIMEDISSDINNVDKRFNAELISFLYRSRHFNISILSILHNLNHSLTKKTSFERTFIDNSSGLFFFKPINNKKQIYNYIRNFISQKISNQLDDIFTLSSSIMSHPYNFIQPHKNLIDEISKIRLDIFGENVFLQSGI